MRPDADPAQTAFAHDVMPFTKLLGVEVISASPEEVVARLAWAAERCTAGGLLHGGALMSLADGVGGHVAFLNLPDGATGTSTLSSSTNFLRGVREGEVTATGRPLHRGRTTIVVDTELRDGEGRLVARVTQTQAVLGGQ
jgi:uncharacterized protein (TIGR00369 family)